MHFLWIVSVIMGFQIMLIVLVGVIGFVRIMLMRVRVLMPMRVGMPVGMGMAMGRSVRVGMGMRVGMCMFMIVKMVMVMIVVDRIRIHRVFLQRVGVEWKSLQVYGIQ